MAVTHTLKTADITTTNSTTYATASVSFTAGKTYLMSIESSDNTAAEEPTISGAGTWTGLRSNTSGASAKLFVYYWVCGSSTTGTVDFSVTQSHTGFGWSIIELDGDDGTPSGWDSGTSSTGSGTSLAVSLDGGTPASTSRVFAFFMLNDNDVQGHDGTGEIYDASVATPNRAHQGVYEDSSDGTITNSATNSTARRGVIVEAVEGSSAQSVTPGLISHAATLYSPQVNQSVSMGLISHAATLYAPQVNQSVSMGLIDHTAALYDPTITPGPVTVGAVDLLDHTASVFAPQINQAADLGVLTYTATLYAPQVNQSVAVGLIDHTAALYDPTVSTSGGPQTVTITAILDHTATLYAPTVNQAADMGLIDHTAALYAPQINQSVAPGLLDHTATALAMQANQSVAVGLLDHTASVFAPQVNHVVSPGLLDHTAQVYAPTVTGGGAIPVTGLDYTWWF